MLSVQKIKRQIRLAVTCMGLMMIGAPDALADSSPGISTQLLNQFNAVGGSIRQMIELDTQVSLSTIQRYRPAHYSNTFCCQVSTPETVVNFLKIGRDRSAVMLGVNVIGNDLLISKGNRWQMSLGMNQQVRPSRWRDNMGLMIQFHSFLH